MRRKRRTVFKFSLVGARKYSTSVRRAFRSCNKMAYSTQETQTADILSLTPVTRSNIVEPIRAWARLYSTYLYLQPVDLEDNTYTLGRAENSDIRITEENIPLRRIGAISKCHFVISRDSELVCIKDMSKNGTFLNGNLIGKGRTNILQNDDEISIGYKGMKVFIYRVLKDSEENRYLPVNLRKKYQVSRLLGRGACGEVRLVFEKISLKPYAVKKIVKATSSSGNGKINSPWKIAREIGILRSLRHQCIIEMIDVEETDDTVFIIFEYMEDGELTNLIMARYNPMSEKQAKALFCQMTMAVDYLHANGVIHRDLKPENILLRSVSDEYLVKISDFGLSRFLDEENDSKRTICGTPKFAAPEVVQRQMYGYQADVWSLGVVLYYMLSKELPFDMSTRFTNDTECAFTADAWMMVSDDAKDLVRRMLTVDPKNRIKMSHVRKHAWIANDSETLAHVDRLLYEQTRTCAEIDCSDSDLDILSEFSSSPPVKRSRTDMSETT